MALASGSVSSVFFGGSRSLPAGGAALVSSVVSRVVASGASVVTGCASGADRAVASVVLAAAPARLRVFCAAQAPAWWAGLSLSRAERAGVQLVPWAGCHRAGVPWGARLALRTRAAVSSVAGSPCVLFLASPSSRGSLAAAGWAVACGSPVFAFCLGFAGPPAAPPTAPAGSWVAACFAGRPCWRWVAAGSLSLF